MSDREIAAQSKMVKDDTMLEEGDSVMADHGLDVEDILAHKNVQLNAPPPPPPPAWMADLASRRKMSRRHEE